MDKIATICPKCDNPLGQSLIVAVNDYCCFLSVHSGQVDVSCLRFVALNVTHWQTCHIRVTLSLQLFEISLWTELQCSYIQSHLSGLFTDNCMQTNDDNIGISTGLSFITACIFVHWLPHIMPASCDPWWTLSYSRCPYRMHTFQTRATGQVSTRRTENALYRPAYIQYRPNVLFHVPQSVVAIN